MPTNRARILEYLRLHPAGADDDRLAAALNVSQRQQVNQICRALASAGILSRNKDPIEGKIVNRLVEKPRVVATCVVPPGAAPASLPVTTGAVRDVGSLVALTQEIVVREFAYAGDLGLTEDQIKQAVASALQADGWSVEVRWGHAPGIDIEARRGVERLVIEAKGEGSLNPMRVNYFLGALGELLQRMNSPDARYGLALPAHRQFVGLMLRLPTWVRERLNLCFFLVRPATLGGMEVGLVSWETARQD